MSIVRPVCAHCGERIDRRRSGIAEVTQRAGRRLVWRMAWHLETAGLGGCYTAELSVFAGQLHRPDPIAVAARGPGRVQWGSAWRGSRPA